MTTQFAVGDTWVGQGECEGHTIRVVSTDTRVVTLPGLPPVKHVLVRCETCLTSWTFGDDPPNDWGD